MSKKRGPKNIINDSNINELKELIIEFDEHSNIKSKISAKDLSEYIQMISVNRELNFKPPSYSWWKTSGKKYIDEYNKIKTQTIRISETEQVDMLDLMDTIEKHGGANKEMLKKLISPTHQIIINLEEKVIYLEKKVESLNEELNETKTMNRNLNATNEKSQELIFSLFSVSQQADSGLNNLLNLGKTKSEVVNLSLQKTFDDPVAFIREMKNKGKSITNQKNTNDKVISIKDKNIKTNHPHEDYDY